MSRYRTYAPGDDPPTDVGDAAWTGVYLNAEPSQLQPGLLADGMNLRCRTGRPVTRRGLWKPAWMNQLDGEKVLPWAGIQGQPQPFKDPNGVEWLILAANEGVNAIRPYNTSHGVPLPAGIKIITEVAFVQAFNLFFMLRGEKMAPLVMESVDDGFRDLVPRWDATKPYEKGDVVAWGPWIDGTTTADGGTLTITTLAPHGLITGSDVVLRNTSGGRQDGRYTVTVVDEFSFLVSPSNMTSVGSTLQWTINNEFWTANDHMFEGDEPGVHASWLRDYLILPNCTNGIFVNNRLMVTTSWIPGGQFDSGGYGAKRDFIAATYVLDYFRYAPSNEFRINQGSADELQALVKIGDSSVLALKSASVALLSNVTGDLTFLSLEMIIRNYGVVNPRAATEVGRDVAFVSPRRGVVSLQQTEQNKIQGTQTAFSNPIQQWIDEIDWTLGAGIRTAYWNDALYVAAPVGTSEALSDNLLAGMPFTEFLDLGALKWTFAGQMFRWSPSPAAIGNEVLLCNGKHFAVQAVVDVTWSGKGLFGIYRNTESLTDVPALGTLQRVLVDVNTAVIVFDYQTGAWQPIHRGRDLAVTEWFVMTVDGIERLCCVTADGYLNLYEESDAGDQVFDPAAPNLLGLIPIAVSAVTRGYTAGNAGFKVGSFARLVLATQAPSYSVATRTEGVSEESVLASARLRDRRVYERPAGATRWVPDNSNHDFYKPYRQDYSVILTELANVLLLSTDEPLLLSTGFPLELSPHEMGFDLDDGVEVDLKQEANHPLRMVRPRGRWHQAVVANTEGIFELRAVALELAETSRQPGLKV
jgi:hypothetical protein